MVFVPFRSRSLAFLFSGAIATLLSSCSSHSPNAIAPSQPEIASSQPETVTRVSAVSRPGDRVSSIFQGDPSNTTVTDAAIALAIANLPANAVTPESVAVASSQLLRSPNKVEFDRIESERFQANCANYVEEDTVFESGGAIALGDVAALLTGALDDSSTLDATTLAFQASNLSPTVNISAEDILFIPGQTNACQFNIQLRFDENAFTPQQQDIIRGAADHWMSAIISDLPGETLTFSGCASGPPVNNIAIDDVFIDVFALEIDGRDEIKAQAGPCAFRNGSDLPAYGFVRFDAADLEDITQNGRLAQIALHEMAHVFGYGTIWQDLGLLTSQLENGVQVPVFVGPLATQEYQKLGGTGFVPVENEAPEDANLAHWRQSVFGNELMTFEGQAGFVPLSRITIAQFADLGYEVNLDAADPYELFNSNP
ncbi:MAG: leishmanolysin-related zinc metalloendopeptidase [Cyanobacteria bacterium J06639_1]